MNFPLSSQIKKLSSRLLESTLAKIVDENLDEKVDGEVEETLLVGLVLFTFWEKANTYEFLQYFRNLLIQKFANSTNLKKFKLVNGEAEIQYSRCTSYIFKTSI